MLCFKDEKVDGGLVHKTREVFKELERAQSEPQFAENGGKNHLSHLPRTPRLSQDSWQESQEESQKYSLYVTQPRTLHYML